MTSVAVAQRTSGIVFHELTGDAWSSAGEAKGLWPAAAPRHGGWTACVIDESSRLEHHGPFGTLEVPGSKTEPPALLGPRLGHYAAWARSGDTLCYVVPDGRALSLRTWRSGESGFRTHLSAAPLFPAWVPGTDWLLCHHGATLSAFETVTGEQRILSASATGFRTPAVSDDGSCIAWAEVANGRVCVMTSGLRTDPRQVATFSSALTLSFRPGTAKLTAAVATSPESGVFASVVSVPSEGEPQRIVKGPLVAYWWAPDGERLVVLHPSYTGDGRFQPRLYDAGGRFLAAMEPLIPAQDTATVIGFFDQYAVSHPNWSADSRWFGICGRVVTEGPHPSFSGGSPDSAFAWDTRAAGAPHILGRGTMLAFER